MLKFKRVLAMMLAFIMTVSMISVAPSTEVNAAPSKYVKSLSLNKSKLTIESGKTAKIKATVKVKGKASTKVKVSLSKANKKVVKKAKVGSPKKGVSTITFTAAKVTSKKTTTIKVVTSAKNSKNKKITKSIKVTVAPKKPTEENPVVDQDVVPSSVTVTAAKSTISVGEATVVTATVLPSDAKDKTVTFTSSNPAVAAVSNTGVVTGISAGEATITATTVNGKVATVKITVVNVEATDITLDKYSADLSVSGTTTVVATVLPENATDKTVTWSSSNETVASVKDGVVTGLSAGTADITAKTANGLTKTCKITVTKKSVLADGVSLEVVNAYEDAMGNEYANTVLVGDDMTIRARVVKDGQPIGNTSVTLTLGVDHRYGTNPDAFEVRESTVVTDTNGYANFVVGLKSGKDYDATSGVYQSYVVKAQESGSNVSEELTIKFASIAINGITVENNRRIDIPDIEPSDNASASDDGIATTYYLEDNLTEEYVSTQQVSGTKDHRVYLTAAPYIVMPATKETAHMGDWEYVVPNGTSGPCSVYNDATNETTTVQVTQIPAGLRFITLEFDKISLSKYVKMYIALYDAATGELLDDNAEKEVTVKEQASKGIQVPIQKDANCFLVVSLVSQGQVDTTHEGYVLKKLVGVWKTENSELTTEKELPGTVKWENISDKVLYELKTSSYAEMKDYLPTDSKYVDEKYQYSYKVPVFPYTGNAIIMVKDTNGESTLAYFMYPTVNNGDNVNVLAPLVNDEDKAVFASDEEAENTVGTMTTDGNMVVIDSTEAGRVGLKATVTVPGLSQKELNSQNGGLLYSSVQFSPIPRQDEVKDYPDHFAIEGQSVVVTAKLYDENGNKKSDEGQKITFKVQGQEVDLKGKTVGSLATLESVSNEGSTDGTGTVTLTIRDLTDNEYYSMVEELTAEAKGYNVKLSIAGAGEVEVADIYWVDLGMTFVDNAIDEESPVRTTQFENSSKNILKKANYTVDDTNGWQIGYVPVARSAKFDKPYDTEASLSNPYHQLDHKNEFISVSGVSVLYSKNSTGVSLEQANNVATLKTTVAGEAELTGLLLIEDSSKVQFTFYNGNGEKVTYNNIGIGSTTVVEQTGLKLTTVWETVDVNVNLVAPKNVYTNTEATVYVVVTDKYNNAIKNAKVVYTVNGVHTMQAEGVTNNKGVLAIPLAAAAVNTAASDVVSVTVNETEKAGCTISYTPESSISAFALRAEDDTHYAITVGEDKKTINVFFSNAVSEDSIKAGQFKFKQNNSEDNTYKVVSAVRGSENTCVTLTLDKAIVSDGADHTLTIAAYTDVATGIVYTLRDTFGQVFAGVEYGFKPNERTK